MKRRAVNEKAQSNIDRQGDKRLSTDVYRL